MSNEPGQDPQPAASAAERARARSPRHRIARDTIKGNRRQRRRIGVGAAFCLGLALLLIGLE